MTVKPRKDKIKLTKLINRMKVSDISKVDIGKTTETLKSGKSIKRTKR